MSFAGGGTADISGGRYSSIKKTNRPPGGARLKRKTPAQLRREQKAQYQSLPVNCGSVQISFKKPVTSSMYPIRALEEQQDQQLTGNGSERVGRSSADPETGNRIEDASEVGAVGLKNEYALEVEEGEEEGEKGQERPMMKRIWKYLKSTWTGVISGSGKLI